MLRCAVAPSGGDARDDAVEGSYVGAAAASPEVEQTRSSCKAAEAGLLLVVAGVGWVHELVGNSELHCKQFLEEDQGTADSYKILLGSPFV